MLVSVGGGGLIAGIAVAIQDEAKVVGVETELTPTLYEARRKGGPVDVEVGGIAVSSLGSKRLGDIAWDVSQRWIDEATARHRRRGPRSSAASLVVRSDHGRAWRAPLGTAGLALGGLQTAAGRNGGRGSFRRQPRPGIDFLIG